MCAAVLGFGTCSFGTFAVGVAGGGGIDIEGLGRRLGLIACRGATDSCILGGCGCFSSSSRDENCTICSRSLDSSNYLTLGNLFGC